MGIFDWFYKGVGEDIAKPIDAVGNLYTTDKARIEAEKDYLEVAQKTQLGQQEINKIYAASPYLFDSAWIPLLGYTSGFLILLFYGPQIIFYTYMWIILSLEAHKSLPFPMSPSDLIYLVGLLYGVGTHTLIKRN